MNVRGKLAVGTRINQVLPSARQQPAIAGQAASLSRADADRRCPNPACGGLLPACPCTVAALSAEALATVNHEERIEEFRRAQLAQGQDQPRRRVGSKCNFPALIILILFLSQGLTDRALALATRETDPLAAAHVAIQSAGNFSAGPLGIENQMSGSRQVCPTADLVEKFAGPVGRMATTLPFDAGRATGPALVSQTASWNSRSGVEARAVDNPINGGQLSNPKKEERRYASLKVDAVNGGALIPSRTWQELASYIAFYANRIPPPGSSISPSVLYLITVPAPGSRTSPKVFTSTARWLKIARPVVYRLVINADEPRVIARFAVIAPLPYLERNRAMSDPSPVHQPSPQSVLTYLRDQIERCRLAHRPDIERHYQQAWEIAANHIYGPLPPRQQSLGYPPIGSPEYLAELRKPETGPPPPWKVKMLAKPFRKIIARDGDQEILECGHRVWHTTYPGSPEAKRRRCGVCARAAENKKSVASQTATKRKAESA